MNTETRGKTLSSIVGLAWGVAVTGSYYWFNHPYYAEKISVFGGYIMGMFR